MTKVMDGYQRMPRKSVWLSQDAYNTLNGLKQKYESQSGETDWGKFLLLVAGVAIGAGILSAIAQSQQSNQKQQ